MGFQFLELIAASFDKDMYHIYHSLQVIQYILEITVYFLVASFPLFNLVLCCFVFNRSKRGEQNLVNHLQIQVMKTGIMRNKCETHTLGWAQWGTQFRGRVRKHNN